MPPHRRLDKALARNQEKGRTFLSRPRQGNACERSPSTSSASCARKPGAVVTSINESSVSMLAEREFRLVEPNNVRHGCADGVGRTHMPMTGSQDDTEAETKLAYSPLAWYVQPSLSHSLSCTPGSCRFSMRMSDGHSRPAARTAFMNLRSRTV